MLTFIQFLEELSKDHITLTPAEVQRMKERFGDKTLQMGQLQEDGCISIPTDCIVEAAHSLGNQKLKEAIESLKNEQVVSMLESAETLVERVCEARKRKLRQIVENFQSEPDDAAAHKQWKEIEKMIFGVEFRD